jgi:phage protein D
MLLVGTVPRPASYELTSAVSSVQVTCSEETGDGFQITFTLGKGRFPDYAALKSGELELFNRVIVAVVLGVMPEVLVDGVITNHQVAPSSDPGMSTLTVTGRDLTVMMDLEEVDKGYPQQSDSVIVQQILGGYGQYGFVPAVMPTMDTPMITDRIPRQYETDLQRVQELARRNGYVFYLEPVTIGVNKAYWGPKVRAGLPQPALTVGMGGAGNVNSLNFSEEGLSAASVKASFIEPFGNNVIKLPALPPLHLPPLSAKPTPSKKVNLLRDTANKGVASALLEMFSAMSSQPDTVSGDGEVDGTRYGHVLRARGLVGVRGAGFSYDGIYYVKSVSHRISRGQYTQSFSLSREGSGALTPMVPT